MFSSLKIDRGGSNRQSRLFHEFDSATKFPQASDGINRKAMKLVSIGGSREGEEGAADKCDGFFF